MVMTRVALAACILTSKKSQDGISKLLFKSDFDKLKSKTSTRRLDEVLTDLWAQAQGTSDIKWGYQCFGQACVRMVIHILGKERLAKQDTFESCSKIVELFQQELTNPKQPVQSAAAASSTTASPDQPVKDLVSCSAEDLALLQNQHILVGHRHFGFILFSTLDMFLCSSCVKEHLQLLIFADPNKCAQVLPP